MNIITLTDYQYEMNNIHFLSNNEFIFGNTHQNGKKYRRVFYKYNIENKAVTAINKKGMKTCEHCYYSTFIKDNYLYTNLREVHEGNPKVTLIKVHIGSGKSETLLELEEDMKVEFINDEYVILMGSKTPIVEEFDVYKDIQGEYQVAFLYDIINKSAYKIWDKRVILSVSDELFTYETSTGEQLLFNEAYMDDYEKEEAYRKRIPREGYYRMGYISNLHGINLDKFVRSIKAGSKRLPFKSICSLEEAGAINYIAMDDTYIYYINKDFEKKLNFYYRAHKETLESQLINTIEAPEEREVYYSAFDQPSTELYEYAHTEDNEILIKEIFSQRVIYRGSGFRESFIGVWKNNMVLNFWTEDSDGSNYESFLKIIDLKNDITSVYKGIADFKRGNVILFS
ncbi:hypothetical protein ACPWSR_08875 [Alloiococcus sp. CFN-8]|uniref:hypothetical protein n=1 Tax=Alloiococcus sp. CFN-8 TaxID=3416081 RepID=UPI003CEA3BC1